MKTTLIWIAASSLLAARGVAQPRYSVIDLSTLGGTFSQATFVNNNRLAVGLSTVHDGTQHAALWALGFKMDIGTPGLNSGAFGANERGQIEVQAESTAKDPNNENFCGYGTGLKCLAYVWQSGILTAAADAGRQQQHGGPDQQSGRGGRDCGEQHSGPGMPAWSGIQRYRAAGARL